MKRLTALAVTTILAGASPAFAQSLGSLGLDGFTVIGSSDAIARAMSGGGGRVCAPEIENLPANFMHYRPPVDEIARGLSVDFCEVAIVGSGSADTVMASASALGLALESRGLGSSNACAAAPSMPAPLSNDPGFLPPPPLSSDGPGFAPPPPPPGEFMNSPPPLQMAAPALTPIAPEAMPEQPATYTMAPVPMDPPPLAPLSIGGGQDIFRSAFETLSRGDAAGAADQFASGLHADPSNHLAHYYLGVAYEQMGRPDYALVQYQRIVEVWPDSAEAPPARQGLLRLGGSLAPSALNPFKPVNQGIRIRRDRPRRARSIEEVFETSPGAKLHASYRLQAKRQATAGRQAIGPSVELQRLASSGRIEQAARGRFNGPRFSGPALGAGVSRSQGAIGTFADRPPVVVSAPEPVSIGRVDAVPEMTPPLLAPLGAPPELAPPMPVMSPEMPIIVSEAPPLLAPPMPVMSPEMPNIVSEAPPMLAPPPLAPFGAPPADMMAAPPAPPMISSAAPMLSAPSSGGTEIAFQDGARYVGEVQNGQPEGTGEMVYADGAKYAGAFRSGLRNGVGRLELADGLIYEGQFAGDAISGLGRLTWPDGAIYEGDFVDGKRTGEGVYAWPSGSKYQGRFEDGVIVGPGVFNAANGERYQGDFQSGRRTGQGTLILPSGEKYVGGVVDGVPNGEGVYLWPDGQRYKGQFVQGRIEGEGTMVYANGQTRTGRWANGQPTG